MPETFVTPKQINAMLRTVNNQRDFLLIHLLFRLGCRISELLPLTVSQIDFKNNIVALQLPSMPRPGPGEKRPKYIADTKESIDKTSALCGIKEMIEDSRRKLIAFRKQKGLPL